SVGNIIEWYDFYIFGSLATILAVKFFEKGHPVAAFLSTVAIFSVGFLIRPLGAFLFGWLGDKVGRKYTFIVTLTGMGVGTALIGFVPTYASIGLAAAFILFVLRLIQGLCLGGEYGGAINYRAEHIADKHSGSHTRRDPRGRGAYRGQASRLLHRLAPDVADPRHRPLAGRDHRHADLPWRGRL